MSVRLPSVSSIPELPSIQGDITCNHHVVYIIFTFHNDNDNSDDNDDFNVDNNDEDDYLRQDSGSLSPFLLSSPLVGQHLNDQESPPSLPELPGTDLT